MTTQLIPFNFDSHPIRAFLIDGNPWFVAKDVCDALSIKNSRKALTALDEDEKGVTSSDTLGGKQNMSTVNESGMYTLALRCRDAVKPGSLPHRFRKWVTAEVLPAIRKQGRYEVPKEPSTLTPAQQRHIQNAVSKLANLPGNSYPSVYRSIKDKFHVGSYKDISMEQYPALCKYLGIKPQDLQLNFVLDGELLDSPAGAISQTHPVNYPATGDGHLYSFGEMMNCGWLTRVGDFLYQLEQHQGKQVTLTIEDVSGLRKEVRSLQHLTETYYARLERVRDATMFAAREARTEIGPMLR